MTNLKQENNASDRVIKQSNLTKSRKQEEQKKLKEKRDALDKELEKLNKSIFEK